MAVIDKSATRSDSAGREQIAVKNPLTGEVIGHIPVCTADDVRQAVARARAIQPAWNALSIRTRSNMLIRWTQLIAQREDESIAAIRRETGKNRIGAFEEMLVIDRTVAYYARHAPEWLRRKTRRPLLPFRHTARVYYKPYGVVGFITPWNYPLLNAFQDLIPALIAGNTVILKPSEITSLVALHMVDLMIQAGIPKDVVQVVTGAGSTGAALVDQVDYIAFTGSTATGRKIAMRAGERLIPCSLELGGKDPLIVLNDARLDLAASGTLAGSLENAGQVCIAVERVYVEAGIHDAFVERICHYAGQMNIGSGDGWDVHMGSMTNERELLRTEAHIADAVAKGATLVHGGKRRPDLGPLFFEPTILTNVNHTMDVMREETFGPIIPIMKVRDADEAIRLANDNQYGLSGAIFTKDLKRGEQLATRVESGDVHVNTTQWIFGVLSAPMGGVKNSGIGRRNGPEGLMRFVRTQSVVIDNQIGAWPMLALLDDGTLKLVRFLVNAMRRFPFLGP